MKYLLYLESILFGLTTFDATSLAHQLAATNSLPNSFNKEKGKAGEDWLHGFMKRHPELSLRQPDATSAGRAMPFNPENINEFFDVYEETMDRYHSNAFTIVMKPASQQCKPSHQKS